MKTILSIILIIISTMSVFSADIDTNEVDLFSLSLKELMNIRVITASKKTEKVSDIPASVVVINRAEIKRNAYQTLQEILENNLGMYAVNDYNVLGTDIGVRGYKSTRANENIVFLVNGVRQTNNMYNNNPLNQIIVPVEAIDRIEIIRGPMAVIYGSGAFFGAINIITNENKKDNPVNMVSTSYGSYNAKKVFVRAENSIDNLHLVFNASMYDDDGMELNLSDIATVLPVLNDNSTINNMARSEKFFNVSGTLDNFYFDMGYTNTQINPFVNFLLSKDAPAIITGTSANIGYKKKISETISFNSKFTYSTYEEEVISDYYDSLSYTHHEIFKANIYEAEFNTFIKPRSDLDITVGLYYSNSPDVYFRIHAPSEGLPTTYAESISGIYNAAAFSQINYQVTKKIKIIAGLRAERKRDNDVQVVFNAGPEPWIADSKTVKEGKIQLIPRIATIFQLTDNHIFKLLYGEAIKSRSFFLSLASLYTPNQPELKQEEIQTFELNYIGTFSPKFVTNISLFRNNLDNLITRVSGVNDEGLYFQYESNVGGMVTNGLETSITAKPIDDLIIKLSATYQHTENSHNKDIEPAFSPNILGYFQTSYLFPYNIIFSLTGKYVGEMEAYWNASYIDANDPSLGVVGRLGQKSDAYFTLNSNVRIDDLFIDGLFMNIKVSNFLDTEVRYPTTTEANWADRGYLGKGRTYMLNIGMEF